MKVNPILNPLEGERVIGVDPPLKPNFEADWRRRLNLYTGRSLSDTALTTEQDGRAGRLATRGQMVSPGVVSGLEVEFERVAHTPTADDPRTEIFFYVINAGFGIAASGEDVIVPRRLRIDAASTRVYAPTRIFQLAGETQPREGETQPQEADTQPQEARKESSRPADGPILTAVPAIDARRVAELAGEARRIRRGFETRTLGPPLGELSPEVVAALPHAAILVLQPVVAEVVGDMNDTDPCEQDPQNFAFDDWQIVDGARLILYAWPEEWAPLPTGTRWRNRVAYTIFRIEASMAAGELLPWEEIGVPIGLVAFDMGVDRYSVVRAGGKPKRRTSLPGFGGSAFMWQARLQQFAEHISDSSLAGKTIHEVVNEFRFLPPAGLLPRAAADFDFTASQPIVRDHFFPSNYIVAATPVPMEQLDAAIEASASLNPLDTFTGDQVDLLVPVPQVWYEPNLLRKDLVDPLFQKAITDSDNRRNEFEHRRKDVRAKDKAIQKSITGKEPTYTEADPSDTITLIPVEEAFGTEGNPLLVTAIKNLKTKLTGLGALSAVEITKVDTVGLKQFISDLDDKVRRADDKIDFGFLNTQTAIYRVRQQMLDNTAATRLATSPSLASIAKGDSALATQEKLKAFTALVKPKITEKKLIGPISASGIEENISFANFSSSGASAMLASSLLAGPTITETTKTSTAVGKQTASEVLIAGTSGATALFSVPLTTRAHVIEQSPIIGEFIDFRTVSIAARLQESESVESRRFAVSAKHQAVADLISLDLNLDGLDVPGVVDTTVAGEKKPNVKFDRFKDPAEASRILQEILKGVHDPVEENADEAVYFSSAVRALDHTIGIYRTVEGRIQGYRIAIEVCKSTLGDLQELVSTIAQRLQEIEDGLAEARHDLAVARVLLTEEEARVQAINDRRKLIIEKHVSFLAYRRPRTADLLADMPFRTIEPGLTEAPVPVCLSHDVPVPPDLRRMVDLLRQVPIKWFVYVEPLLDKLDRIDILRETVNASVARAQLQVQATPASAGLHSKAIDAVFTAQYEAVARQRVQIANLDLGEVAVQNWKVIRERASATVSLASLIEAGHGRSDVAAQAARELNDITHIAACLYQMFSEVLPSIRLEWAERLSQYDAPVNLRNLSSLPRWGERKDGKDVIPFLDRRQMQALTDWLYGRVDPLQAEAVSSINDLVRICILLASHAPVNQIISGHVPKPTTVTKGGRVELAAADFTKVRVGMHVLMYVGSNVVARGVVDDLSSSHVTAQVVHTATPIVSLAEEARVEFGDPDSFGRAALKLLKA